MLAGAGLLTTLSCGGGDGDGNKTFKGDGYSFSYPGKWAEQAADVNTGRSPDVVVAPPEGGRNLVALLVLRDGVSKPVTKANIDQMMPDLRPAIDGLMLRSGGVLEGDPTRVAYGGLPGLRFESSSTGLNPPVHMQGTWLFDGTIAYTFACQFVPSAAEEVGQACDLVLESFQISD
jgi:hypothetical protein